MSINRLKKIAQKLNVLDLANVVLDDPRFPVWTGASRHYQHHYGNGQLLIHVTEVVDLCLQTCDYFGIKEKDKMYLAALFHDVGKMWDYEIDNNTTEWTSNKHINKIHHISRSGLVWCEAAKNAGWKQEDIDDVWHCILSHHGLKEWGSPVQPRTQLAWILHLCDSISARMDDYHKRIPFSNDPLTK
jgi:3'-5' exoribonuclease